MKTFFRLLFSCCVLAIIFSSCGKKNDEGRMIPTSALFVAQVDMKSMNDNLSWNDIKQTSWYKKAYSNSATQEWRKKILDNPGASGIDFDKGLVFFVNKGTAKNFNFVVEGAIKSEKDFEQFNKNFDPAQRVRKEGDINLVTLKDKNVVGWNGKRFAYVMNSGTTSSEMYSWKDSANSQSNMAPSDNSAELSAFCAKLFYLKSDSSLEKNEKFADLLKEKGDIHVWQNTEEIMKNSPSMGMLGMLKLDAIFKDNISTYTVKFDKGKINVDQRGYAGKELTGLLKKYLDGKINTDIIKNIPSQNVFAVLSANFKPEGIRELAKLTGTDGFINMYAQQMGFTLDDIVKSNNGDWMIAFTDLKMKPDSNYKVDIGNNTGFEKLPKPGFNYIFSVGVNDKASLQKLIDAGKKMSSQLGKDSFINYDMNDKTFAFSNSNTFAKQYLAGGNNKYDFTDKINGHPIGVFIDFHKILSAFAAETANRPDLKAMMDQSMKTWNNLFMTGGDYKDGAFTANTQINLLDQNTNSLEQLNNYFDEMFKIQEAKKARNAHKSNLDSLLIPPSIDTVKIK